MPGIIEGAAQGKGRGRQVVAVCKTADLILMMLDATKGDYQKRLLENEIESVGLRLNKKKPDIYFKKKTGGGMKINATVKMTHLTEKLIQSVLQDYKIYNAEVLVREDCTVDEFIDVILGNRKYVPCLYCYNKIDAISLERVEELASRPHSTVISVEYKLGLDMLIDQIWDMLEMLRIYTKKRGEFPDLSGGVVVRHGATIEHVCHAIHRNLVKDFKYALVWGRSAKHQPQKVGITHSLNDEDVVQILKK